MAALSSVTRCYAASGETTKIQYFKGIYPASAATATLLVSDLNSNDDVVVRVYTAVTGYTIPLIELRDQRTTGPTGTIVVGTADGSNSPATTAYINVVVTKAVQY